MNKNLESKIKIALQNAEQFYRYTFEITGGCDHSVGICECSDRRDYDSLKNLMKDLNIETKD